MEPHAQLNLSDRDVLEFDDAWRRAAWSTKLDGPDLPAATTWAVLIVGLAVADIVGNVVVDDGLQIPAKLAIVLVAVTAARWSGVGWGALGLSTKRITRGLKVGGLAAAAIAVVVAVGLFFPALTDIFESDGVTEDGPGARLHRVLVAIPLGTVVFEEILFRSVTMGVLLSIHSIRGAVIGHAVLFGFWHLVSALGGASGSALTIAGSAAATVAATAVAGLGFGWLRLRANSVVAPAVAHLSTNVLGYLAAVMLLDR